MTTLRYNQSGFMIGEGSVQFSHKYNDVREAFTAITLHNGWCNFHIKYNDVPLTFEIPAKFKWDDVREVLIFQKDNKYFISVGYEPNKPEYKDNNQYQAIDLGITKIVTAVNSKGKFLEVKTPHPDKYWNPTISKLQSRRDHCRKYSKRWYLLNNVINKLKQKQENQIKDFQHKLSRKLMDNTRSNTIICR